MKVSTPSYVKTNMAKVLDAALEGQPTVIVRKGRLAIVKEYDPQRDSLSRLQAAFDEGGGVNREPTASERKLIRNLTTPPPSQEQRPNWKEHFDWLKRQPKTRSRALLKEFEEGRRRQRARERAMGNLK